MSDSANYAYGALFERLYVLRDSVVAMQGGRGPMEYKMEVLEEWLMKNVGEQSQ